MQQTSQDLTTNPRFYVPALLFLVVFGLNDWNDWVDECLVAYATNAAIAMMSGAVYLWWWHHTGNATDVYRWVTAFFFALAYSNVITLYARWLYVGGCTEAYRVFLDTFVWHTRVVPTVLVQLYMMVLVANRLQGDGKDNMA